MIRHETMKAYDGLITVKINDAPVKYTEISFKYSHWITGASSPTLVKWNNSKDFKRRNNVGHRRFWHGNMRVTNEDKQLENITGNMVLLYEMNEK